MKAGEIREQFLQFFEAQGHTRVPSSPLVPANDPTLLFTNSGMVQFKDIFLGEEESGYVRAASSQRCVRAGGKHNDLENVGYTSRHHTFFEMLGNFSFGDYFKKDAINYAWEFMTQVLNLPPERLWVTVFRDDDEAADIWLNQIRCDERRFVRIGEQDNFWAMGDVGPCGPCTEIFYDHGDSIAGGPPGSPEQEGDRFVEIWNLVFMQYERAKDGSVAPLSKQSVDTGMGLERIAAVVQGVTSNYATDLFQGLIKDTAALLGTNDLSQASLRVIADHIRACAFLIADGVIPSNEDRGYVLRRIIRRALRHGHKFGVRDPFFHRLVEPLSKVMGEAYPELVRAREQIGEVLIKEEKRFSEMLNTGLEILEKRLTHLPDGMIPGDIVFELYDTYGFPVDLTADVAREKGWSVDLVGFEACMDEQKTRGRDAGGFSAGQASGLNIEMDSVFTGYDETVSTASVCQIFVDGQAAESVTAGSEAMMVLDRTPFYGESGGQVGDVGRLLGEGGEFEVRDTQKQGAAHKHIGVMRSGTLKVGDTVRAEIEVGRRVRTVLNHSATHLLHAALREVLGKQVVQKGSLVDDRHLRFDFSYEQPMTQAQISAVEVRVNEQIRCNVKAEAEVMPKDEALKQGAMALFGERYSEQVRVLTMGDFSVELCGGTHVNRTGDIGLFLITSEIGVAAGIRRIEAVTGESAWQQTADRARRIQSLCASLKTDEVQLEEKLTQLLAKNKELEKKLEQQQMKLASEAGSELVSQAVEVNGINVLAARVEAADRKSLRGVLDQLKEELGTAAVVLATTSGDKVHLIAGVTEDCTDKLQAGNLVNMVAEQVGGKGGGRRPDLAEAGGNDPRALDKALASVSEWVHSQVQ